MTTLLYMKKVFFSLFFFAFSIQLFAQNDSIIPKWGVGFQKKINYTAYVPQKVNENVEELRTDTMNMTLDWKIVSDEDSMFTFSISPITFLNFDSDEEGDFTPAIEKLKEANVTFLYQVNKKGKLVSQVVKNEEVENSFLSSLLVESKYFVNYEELKTIFKTEESGTDEDFLEEVDPDLYELYEDEEEVQSWEFKLLVNALEKMLDNIHAAMGEPYYLDSIVQLNEISGEELDKIQQGMSAMAKMMDMQGSIQTVKEGDYIVYNMKMTMEMGKFISQMAQSLEEAFKDEDKKVSKKEKKEQAAKKEELDNFQMSFDMNSYYYFTVSDYIPLKSRTEVTSDISSPKESGSFTASFEFTIE